MHPTPVSALRSVEIGLPDVVEAERFYTETWNLSVAARSGSSVYLRGAGSDHHLLALHRAERAEVRTVTFRSPSVEALDTMRNARSRRRQRARRARSSRRNRAAARPSSCVTRKDETCASCMAMRAMPTRADATTTRSAWRTR
jgi:catechol-2,3-dioxygenase